MKKNEIIKEVAERATDKMEKQISQKVVDAVLAAYADCVAENVKAESDEKVPLPGVGRFEAHKMAARSGKSQFGTTAGKTWTKPEHYILKFTPSASAKDL